MSALRAAWLSPPAVAPVAPRSVFNQESTIKNQKLKDLSFVFFLIGVDP
jgi:hypothetical protein